MAKAKKAPMKQTASDSVSILDHDLDVPGIAFRWINGDVRNQMGNWMHWTVVTRDSEIGEKIEGKLDTGHSKFAGGNEDSNYYRRGQLVLAWAPEDVAKAYREQMDEKAEDRLRQVVKGQDFQRIYIPITK